MECDGPGVDPIVRASSHQVQQRYGGAADGLHTLAKVAIYPNLQARGRQRSVSVFALLRSNDSSKRGNRTWRQSAE